MSCLGLNVIQNGRLQVLYTIFIIFLILIYNLFWKDCFDHNNIETLKNFTFVSCNESLKCSNGLCFENLTKDNKLATCLTNTSLLTSAGSWKVSLNAFIVLKFKIF